MCITAIAMCLLMVNMAFAAELKIGIVDMREIMTNSEPAKKAQATMKSKFGTENDRLEKQAKELQKLSESLKTPGNQSREALEQKRAEFIRKNKDLDQKAREFRAKVEKEDAQLRNDLLDFVIGKVAKDYAVKKGLACLLDSSGFLYADESMEVTKDFMEEVNRQWKSSQTAPSDGGNKKK